MLVLIRSVSNTEKFPIIIYKAQYVVCVTCYIMNNRGLLRCFVGRQLSFKILPLFLKMQ